MTHSVFKQKLYKNKTKPLFLKAHSSFGFFCFKLKHNQACFGNCFCGKLSSYPGPNSSSRRATNQEIKIAASALFCLSPPPYCTRLSHIFARKRSLLQTTFGKFRKRLLTFLSLLFCKKMKQKTFYFPVSFFGGIDYIWAPNIPRPHQKNENKIPETREQ